MSNLERYSALIGASLIGLTAYLVKQEQDRIEERSAASEVPPVEQLSERLKEAWSGHHTP